jgi:outer membrane protein OmpA-like peptidoglycan-associated protein
MKAKKVVEESGEKAPLWIISFADMISLLMAFFVMLQALATEQSNEFLMPGSGQFELIAGELKRNLDGFGIPDLLGKPSQNQNFSSRQVRYKYDSPDTQPVVNPAVDGNQESMRRIFSQLTKSSRSFRPQLGGSVRDFSYAPLNFAEGSAALDNEARNWLKQYAVNLGQMAMTGGTRLYVVGLAPDTEDPARQWTISEQRARNVVQFLQSQLPEKVRGQIYWWGAGAGGEWSAGMGNASEKTHILLTFLRGPK